MNADRQYRSQLFTVRVWLEPDALHPNARPPSKLRFKAQHVLSGEVRYFRDWPALVVFLLSVAQADEGTPSESHLSGEDDVAT